MRRTAALSTIATVAGLLGGCSSSAPKAPASGSTPASVSKPAGTTSPAAPVSVAAGGGSGACKYISTAQAATLAGSPVKPGVSRSLTSGPVTFQYCDFIFDPGNAPGVTIAVADLKGNGSALFAALRSSKQSETDYRVVPAVGDEAFFANENLDVRKGNTGLVLYVGRADGSPRGPAGLPDEKQLAALILAHI